MSGAATANPDLLVRRFGAHAFVRGAAAWVKDGIHDMAVILKHDGRHINAIRGWTHAYPWTTCPGAVDQLGAFLGAPIGSILSQPVDQQSQCTHLFDLARLAMAQAARGGRARYRLVVARREGERDARLEASIERDGVLLLCWELGNYVVVAPPDLAGHSVDGRAVLPPEITRDPGGLEAAMMLRRAVKMFRGRYRAMAMVVDVPPAERGWMLGACYTFQRGVVEKANRATLVDMTTHRP